MALLTANYMFMPILCWNDKINPLINQILAPTVTTSSVPEPGLTCNGLKGMSKTVVRKFFRGVDPVEYLFVAIINKRQLEDPAFDLDKHCSVPRTCTYLNTAITTSSSPNLVEKKQITGNANIRTSYFRTGRDDDRITRACGFAQNVTTPCDRSYLFIIPLLVR